VIKTIVQFCIALSLTTIFLSSKALAEDFSYESISQRYSEVRLDDESVKQAKMEGECLVGLKNLNFRKKEDFDAVAEWTSYRSFSLLEQFSPCKVLIIMEVAQSKLKSAATGLQATSTP
jgi:hypothetical protein